MTTATTTTDSVVRFHPMHTRVSDDDPDLFVVGRPEVGEFIEVPGVGMAAIRRLDAGHRIRDVEEWLAEKHDAEVDLGEFVDDLIDVGFVASIDGEKVPDPFPEMRPHMPWLTASNTRWLFGKIAKAAYAALIVGTAVTLFHRPDLTPEYRDFWWGDYVGLCVLVNTVLFSVAVTLHELSHLVAARSLGAPARISFATRLHHLVVQTDVTAVWTVPRRQRYRVYLSGLLCDLALVCGAILVIAYARPGALVERLLAALAVAVVMSMALQAHVYMRTDLYFVLLDLLRCRNLFHDGLAYARHLARRTGHRLLPRLVGAPGVDPTADLPARERRAVRLYAVAVVVGSTVALAGFIAYGLPIVVHGVLAAARAVGSGSLLATVDAGLLILVEGALQVLFLVTFHRRHRHRLPRLLGGRRPARPGPAAVHGAG